MSGTNSISHDPIFYFTVGFFALLTTGLPALMGQPRFMPILQTLALTIFVAVALRQGHVRGALNVMLIWLPIQFVVLTLLSRFFSAQIETAFTNGFLFRDAITSWYFGGGPYPIGLVGAPFAFVIEVVGVLVGSLATAGLAGVWFLVRLLNQSAFGAGILMAALENSSQSLFVLPYWALARAAGYAGWVVLCSQPFLTANWSPVYYWKTQRSLLIVSVGLLFLGILLEILLPGIVARTPIT